MSDKTKGDGGKPKKNSATGRRPSPTTLVEFKANINVCGPGYSVATGKTAKIEYRYAKHQQDEGKGTIIQKGEG